MLRVVLTRRLIGGGEVVMTIESIDEDEVAKLVHLFLDASKKGSRPAQEVNMEAPP
jgi:hypothetical protein